MKRRGFTLIELLVVVAILAVVAAILFPIFVRRHPPAYRSSCQSNLKQIGLGIRQYTQDHNAKFPLINVHAVSTNPFPYSTPYGWADALQPYVKSTQLFKCGLRNSQTNQTQNPDATTPGFTDYWLNTNVAGVSEKLFIAAASTLSLGEGNDGTDGADARYNRNVIPRRWIDKEDSPARRHLNGANYAFVDGHVKWYKPDKLSQGSPKNGAPTFLVR